MTVAEDETVNGQRGGRACAHAGGERSGQVANPHSFGKTQQQDSRVTMDHGPDHGIAFFDIPPSHPAEFAVLSPRWFGFFCFLRLLDTSIGLVSARGLPLRVSPCLVPTGPETHGFRVPSGSHGRNGPVSGFPLLRVPFPGYLV